VYVCEAIRGNTGPNKHNGAFLTRRGPYRAHTWIECDKHQQTARRKQEKNKKEDGKGRKR